MLESLSRPRAGLNFRRFGLCRVFVCRTNEIGLETTSPFLVRAIVLNVPYCGSKFRLHLRRVSLVLSEVSPRAYKRLQVALVPKGLRWSVKRRFEAEAVSSTCAASVRRTRPACMRSVHTNHG